MGLYITGICKKGCRQERSFASRQHSALTQVRHWIRKHRFFSSMEAINKESIRLLRLFGNTTSKKVTPSVGPEQEYFLVDAKKFYREKTLFTQDVHFSEQCRRKDRSLTIITLERSVRGLLPI